MLSMFVMGFKRSASLARACAALVGLSILACGNGTGGETAADRVRESGFRGITMERPTPKADFTLNDTEGRPFHFAAETEGYVTLLFFGYTSCPDVCPVHLANLSAVLKDQPWEVRQRIKVVFVTTDPERDTPERIRAWLDAFDTQFIGLTGDRNDVNLIQASFGLPPAVVQGGTATNPIIGHASQILAFGFDNVARIAYPFGTRQADWAHDLPRLVRQAPTLDLSAAVIAAPISGDLTALYLTISNRGEAADDLIAITTDAAERTEIHRQVDHGGLTTMEEVASLPIPAGGQLVMEPGGYHLMLLGLRQALAPGDLVPIELSFLKAGRVRHHATVHSYADLESALDEAALHTGHTGRGGE
jgi:protein SCO1/2